MKLIPETGKSETLQQVLLPSREQVEYDPGREYRLYALGEGSAKGFIEYTEEEVIAEFCKNWGKEPEYVLKHGGGWTVGPVPVKNGRI